MSPRASLIALPIAMALSSGLLLGCVSAKEYEALEQDLAKARQELTKTRGEVQDLSVALTEAESTVDVLDGRVSELEQALALAESRASEAETELAGVLKESSQLEASVEDMQQALAELKRLRAQAEARAAVYRNVLDKFKSLIDNGKLKAKIVDGRMVLELQTDILFDSGKAELSELGTATITEVGQLLAELADRKFQVEGHTDNVPIKNKRYPSNWELASARAINVVKAMIEAGMNPALVSAAAFADTRPSASNETEEGRAANRRIEIVIVPDLSELPGAEDIERMFS